MFHNNFPQLNLHGETRDFVEFLVNDFINDNIKLKNEFIGIIHGRSSDILKNKVHNVLKQNKLVLSYKVDIFNPGITLVKLQIK